MIKVDKVEDGLPISVIVPLSKNRRGFFDNYVLPLIEANNPIEIIVNDDEGRAPKKRNDGFKKSTQPFLFFCDDDIMLPANYLESLYNTLLKHPDVGFAYTGYVGIVLHPESHPMHGNFSIPAVDFNSGILRRGNYISTMTLVRRELFPGFDENLKRLQDWDVWLTVVKNGSKGILVPNLSFFAYYLDSGITSNTNSEIDAINAIRIKHNL
jgi:hypothetical protein